MYCISISYKNADLQIRKQFAFSEIIQKEILQTLIKENNINECVILCTCNRTELYFCGDSQAVIKVKDIISKYSDSECSKLSKHMFLFYGDKAISHLYSVASGIDSMVIGEDEILGQVKRAYAIAQECKTTGYEINMIFQSAITSAKRIKTETLLSKTSVSMATLASNEVAKFGDNLTVMVIGVTGKIGTSLVKNLVSHKNINLITTLRNHNHNLTFKKEISTIDYKDRYSYIDEIDCLISATSSPHYTITFYDLQKSISIVKNRLFIDLAVPPDIDREIEKIPNIKLIGVDYIETLAKENNSLKIDSVESAKKIISEEIDILKKNMIFHNFLPYMETIKENLKNNSFEEIIYKMRDNLSAEEFEKILDVYKSLGGE